MRFNGKSLIGRNINYIFMSLLFIVFTNTGCNSSSTQNISSKVYSDEQWLQMVKQPENQVKTFWSGKDIGTIVSEGQWSMSLSGLHFVNTPANMTSNQVFELTRKIPLLFLPLFDERDPGIVLTGIYFYENCYINDLNPKEQEKIRAAFMKALEHSDTRVRCAAIETLEKKHFHDVETIKRGLNDEATIVRAMTASFLGSFFTYNYYDPEIGLDNSRDKRVQIKHDMAPILIDHLNDTSFYVRQMCATTFISKICSNINDESTGNRFNWVTSDWKSRVETQKQWKDWWNENGDIEIIDSSIHANIYF